MTNPWITRRGGHEARHDDERFAFVPHHLAAQCADCWGYFLLPVGRCPGCGSKHFSVPARKERAA